MGWRPALGSWLLLFSVAATSAGGCYGRQPTKPHTQLRLASGTRGDGLTPLGDVLVEVCRRALPDLDVRHLATGGSILNVEAVEQRRADLAFAQADIAYLAFQGRLTADSSSPSDLRGVAVLFVRVLHLLVSGTREISRPADLRGARVGIVFVGPRGATSDITLQTALQAAGLSLDDIRPQWLNHDDAADRFRDGKLDAAFTLGRLPQPLAQQVFAEQQDGLRPAGSRRSATGSVKLLSLDNEALDAIRARAPFLRTVVIPSNTYPGQFESVTTVGVEMLLICNRLLGDDIVYSITRGLYDSQTETSELWPPTRSFDLDTTAATPIPLHPGAARFYREQALFR